MNSTVPSRYLISSYAPIRLEVDPQAKHATLVEGLQLAPEPWTARQAFKPLNTSQNKEIWSHYSRRKDFSPWVDDLSLVYQSRVPGSLLHGVHHSTALDRLLITIEPSRMQPSFWVDGLVDVVLKHFEPAVLSVQNKDGRNLMFDADDVLRANRQVVPHISGILRDAYSLYTIPQVLFLSHDACRATLNLSTAALSAHLTAHDVPVDTLERGILIRGADGYISAKDYIALSHHLTGLVKMVIGAKTK
jgi:hypothetical protein